MKFLHIFLALFLPATAIALNKKQCEIADNCLFIIVLSSNYLIIKIIKR
jgi:hypothetical protein